MADWQLSGLDLAWAGCACHRWKPTPGSLVVQMQLVGTRVIAPGKLLGFARHPFPQQSAQRVLLLSRWWQRLKVKIRLGLLPPHTLSNAKYKQLARNLSFVLGLKPINSQIIKGVTYNKPLSPKLFMVWALALHSFLGLPEAMLICLWQSGWQSRWRSPLLLRALLNLVKSRNLWGY